MDNIAYSGNLSKRLEIAQRLLVEYSKGNFDFVIESYDSDDELDSIIMGINMLGEEIQAITTSKKYYQSLLNGIKSPLIILDENFFIKDLNSATTDCLNFRKSDLINTPLSYIIPKSSKISARLEEKLSISRFQPTIIEDAFLTKSGRIIPFILTFSLLEKTSKHEGGILCLAQEISDIKNKEKAIQELNEELNGIIYNISHELRSPVANLLGLLQLSQNIIDKDSVENREDLKNYLSLSVKATEHLDQLLKRYNTLLTLRNDNYDKSLNLQKEVTVLLQRLQLPSEIDIYFDIEIPSHVFVDVDRLLLRQALEILLFNALKFHKPSNVNHFISINYSENYKYHKLVITDNGIGISQTHLQELTDKMYSQSIDSRPNTLGLFLANYIIDSLNGKIEIESLLGEYTAVTVFLPKS